MKDPRGPEQGPERSGGESPRVLIVHGALGSRLGFRGRFFDDELWLDPLDVRRGNLDLISFGPSGDARVQVLGIMRSAYLAPRWLLAARGYRVDFYAYDWRRPVHELGAELVDYLEKAGDRDVRLVCHSYGGLVTRSALAQGAQGVTRVVTLGTPHRGAFSTVMLLRGSHPVLQRIAALDHRGDARGLAREVFGTFPGTYHLLPEEGLQEDFEVYSPASWPEDDPRPDPALLQAARAGWAGLAPIDERFTCVAGLGCPTPAGVHRAGERGFRYRLSLAGDSVVPVESAAPEGARAYYVEGGHGTLPWLPALLEALPDLVERGETDLLARAPGDRPDYGATDDQELDARLEELKQSLRLPSLSTLDDLLTEYAAPAPETALESGTQPEDPPESSTGSQESDRAQLLVRWGEDPNGAELLAPEAQYFDHPDGFVAFQTSLLRPVVSGDPICREGALSEVLSAFLDRHPRAVFFRLGKAAGTALEALQRGYRLCPLGREWWLDLATLPVSAVEALEVLAGEEEEHGRRLRILRRRGEGAPAGEAAPAVGEVLLDPWFLRGKQVGYRLRSLVLAGATASDGGSGVPDRVRQVILAVAASLHGEGWERLCLGILGGEEEELPSTFPRDEKMHARLRFLRSHLSGGEVAGALAALGQELGGEALERFYAIPQGASVTRSILRYLRISGLV